MVHSSLRGEEARTTLWQSDERALEPGASPLERGGRGRIVVLHYYGRDAEEPREAPTSRALTLLRQHPATALGLIGLAGFAMMAALVQERLFTGLDYSVAQSMRYVGSPVLDWWATVAGNLASAEFAMVYAVVLALVLWRTGAGWWALAPFAFVVPTGVELALKSWLTQPPIPPGLHFHVPATSNLPTVALEGSFPSGHALRSAFFCTILAILLWNRGRPLSRLLAAALIALPPAVGLAMVYVSWHWTSDVVAGLLLGASVAIPVARAVAERLESGGPAGATSQSA